MSREVRSHAGSLQLADLVQSLFAVELVFPSKLLFLHSPWISDFPAVSNAGQQLQSLVPDISTSHIGFADVLARLAEHGTDVRIAGGKCDTTDRFLSHLRRAAAAVSMRGSIQIAIVDSLHEKGLLGERFYLEGSMNFTWSGVFINDEKVVLHSDESKVAENKLAFLARWKTYERNSERI